MPGFFGRVLFHAVLFGEVVCILGATAPAGAQDAVATAQVNRSEAVLSTSVRPFGSRTSHVETFAAFLREIGADDLAARKEAITGEKQARVDWTAVNQASIGLTDEEWKTAYSILLDGSQRVANWGDAMQDSLGWKDGRFEAVGTARAKEQMARFDALSEDGDSIVDDTMTRLRQGLGEDAFRKLDAFVYQREGGVNQGPIRKGPIETARATPIAAQK
jgi:hypothetical protein